MTDAPIYLDHNASTPLLPAVREAMLPWLRGGFGNPSSQHVYGRRARQAVEDARAQVARLLDCEPDELYFTSGGTESNNLAIRGTAEANPQRRSIITSIIEHPATQAPCAWLEGSGYTVHRAAVDAFGELRADDIHRWLSADTLLITVAHANSETGTLQPLAELAASAHRHGALLHADAAQSVAKVDVSVREEGMDLLSVAGHKLYAPRGVGALCVRSGTPIEPLLRGAGHERGLRPGTENVASIVGLGVACEVARSDLAETRARIERLRHRLWELLRAEVPGLALNGHPEKRLPNTLNIRFPAVSGSTLLAACPGIAASTGSACHAEQETASEVILAMGVAPQEALGSVRLSLGRGTTEEQIDAAAGELIQAWKGLQT